jgi:hypothetical protein
MQTGPHNFDAVKTILVLADTIAVLVLHQNVTYHHCFGL